QLKSAWTLGRKPHGHGARYQIACGCGPKRTRRYTAGDIDFLIAYIADGSISGARSFAHGDSGDGGDHGDSSDPGVCPGSWYILPAPVIQGCLSAYFTQNPTRSRFLPYRDAWNLLRG